MNTYDYTEIYTIEDLIRRVKRYLNCFRTSEATAVKSMYLKGVGIQFDSCNDCIIISYCNMSIAVRPDRDSLDYKLLPK